MGDGSFLARVSHRGMALVVDSVPLVPNQDDFKRDMSEFDDRDEMLEYVAELLIGLGYDEEMARLVQQ